MFLKPSSTHSTYKKCSPTCRRNGELSPCIVPFPCDRNKSNGGVCLNHCTIHQFLTFVQYSKSGREFKWDRRRILPAGRVHLDVQVGSWAKSNVTRVAQMLPQSHHVANLHLHTICFDVNILDKVAVCQSNHQRVPLVQVARVDSTDGVLIV